MARYVDGFLLPIPKKNLAAYRRMATKAGKIWMEHGALEYMECAGDDLKKTFGLAFTKTVKTKANENVFYSFIVYKSRAHRDKVNKAVMADERLNTLCDPKKMPFDVTRMNYGGFKAIVDFTARGKARGRA
jgi:uncharacterized protein YbaA (DUF1428 family)